VESKRPRETGGRLEKQVSNLFERIDLEKLGNGIQKSKEILHKENE
jgi:hypothetical protein